MIREPIDAADGTSFDLEAACRKAEEYPARNQPRAPRVAPLDLGNIPIDVILGDGPILRALRRVGAVTIGSFLGFMAWSGRLRLRRTARRTRLLLPPGTRLRTILSFIYSRKSVETFFEPLLADIQHEWLDAMACGHHWHARWIRLRGYVDLARHLGLVSLISLGRKVVRFWQMSAGG